MTSKQEPFFTNLKPPSTSGDKKISYRKAYIFGVLSILLIMAAIFFVIVVLDANDEDNKNQFGTCNCNQNGFIKLDSNSCVLPINDGVIPVAYQPANDIFNATGFTVKDYVNVTDINGNSWVIYNETLQRYVWRYKLDFRAFLLLTNDEHGNLIKILIDGAVGIISPSVLVDNANLYPILLERNCENIDLLINTHMHADHTGWFIRYNDMEEIIPSFTNATYIVSSTEYEFWMNASESMEQSVRLNERFPPILETNQLQLMDESDYFITPKLEVKNCSGHTAGHSCIVFYGDYQSNDQMYLFWGDLIHREIQISKPEIYPPYDIEPIIAMNKRIEIIDYIHDNDIIVFPTHFNEEIIPGKIVECSTCFATNNLTWKTVEM